MKAILLAAGEGKRFFESGSKTFKQLYPYNNEPIIKRCVRTVKETLLFNEIIVVLGQNDECNEQIKKVLNGEEITYIINNASRKDNNFLSVLAGLSHCKPSGESIIIIETDCIFTSDDLKKLTTDLSYNEIRWSNLGPAFENQTGGFLLTSEIDSGEVHEIKIVGKFKDDDELVLKKKYVKKMFGLTAMDSQAILKYLELSELCTKKEDKYFHQIIMNAMSNFVNKTVAVEEISFSFNTLKEINK
tara:strand:- start:10133 stop:10867 length:735 start_codon:yes stop_codon:yes gene_type:complete